MRYLDSDGVSTTYFHEEDGYAYCKTVQDADPIIDLNTHLRNNRHDKPCAPMHHVGSVPLTQHYEWRKEWLEKYRDKMTFEQFIVRQLSNRDFSKFRSTDKKLYIPRRARNDNVLKTEN